MTNPWYTKPWRPEQYGITGAGTDNHGHRTDVVYHRRASLRTPLLCALGVTFRTATPLYNVRVSPTPYTNPYSLVAVSLPTAA